MGHLHMRKQENISIQHEHGMQIIFHKNFKNRYKKLSRKAQIKFKERLKLFTLDPYNPLLNNHSLHGKWQDFRSINITGDVRAIYKPIDSQTVEFVLIDSHSNLYI